MSRKTGMSENSTTEQDARLQECLDRMSKLVVVDPAKIAAHEDARRQEQIAERYASAGFPETLQKQTFEKATWSEGTEEVRAIYRAFENWRPRKSGKGILLMGKPGRDKSYLMHAIINRLVQNGLEYFEYFPFGKMIRNLWSFPSSSARERYWTRLCKTSHLFINDLGRAPRNPRGGPSTWWVELFFEFVDTHEAYEIPVCYTTNLDRKQLRELLGGATFERLQGNCNIVVLKGPNRRE